MIILSFRGNLHTNNNQPHFFPNYFLGKSRDTDIYYQISQKYNYYFIISNIYKFLVFVCKLFWPDGNKILNLLPNCLF